jgi:hypothetical protein
VTVSGFVGVTYPSDIAGQRAIFTPLLTPLVLHILGPGTDFDVYPRRGAPRNGTLPPCEVGSRFIFIGYLWLI